MDNNHFVQNSKFVELSLINLNTQSIISTESNKNTTQFSRIRTARLAFLLVGPTCIILCMINQFYRDKFCFTDYPTHLHLDYRGRNTSFRLVRSSISY